VGEAKGLRMPVHADDLASACLAAIEHPATYGQAYDLSGGETLSYLAMAERIFEAEGIKPRFVRIPLAVFENMLRIARLLPRYRYLTGEMAQRMNQDLCFAHEAASRDFGFAPRRFEPPS
jgi:nucleoside-diphosphate-sugar epimerase